MITELYTFGCSFTRDNYQHTWADLVADRFGLNLHNRAERGAGASFISKRVLTSDDMDPKNSLIMIMWPCADRFDLWADATAPHLVNDQIQASWPDGTQPMLVDLQGRRRHDQGWILNGSVPRGYKHHYYKYFYTPYQAVHDWYCNIILTQLYLKSKNFATAMMSAFGLLYPLQYHHGRCQVESRLFDTIDLDQFVGPSLDLGFLPWCASNHLPFLNLHYPATIAHERWLDTFVYQAVAKKFLHPAQRISKNESSTSRTGRKVSAGQKPRESR